MKPIFHSVKVVEKGWGREVWLANNEEYCGKLLHFKAGKKFSLHYHLAKRETFYVLAGTLDLFFPDTETGNRLGKRLEPGDAVEIPRGLPHQIRAVTDATIIEVSTHHEDADSYRVEPGDSQA